MCHLTAEACATPTAADLDSYCTSESDEPNIEECGTIITPEAAMQAWPLSSDKRKAVRQYRRQVRAILDGSDDRLVVVVGPCSIHCVAAALQYADRLAALAQELGGELFLVMRVYFEKPRTTVGWKGLINDPALDGSNKVNDGLLLARKLLCQIAEKGLPAGCELLDTITPQFLSDTVTWGAIGARTTESQIHRELASGAPMPIGFKNGTDGSVQIAVDAIKSASQPHTYPSVTRSGAAAVIRSRGNQYCHAILRGSNTGPNYSGEHVASAVEKLTTSGVQSRLIVDVSHGNSAKKAANQPKVLQDICQQLEGGSYSICGVMVESNLHAGAQKLTPGETDVSSLQYGVSVTDECVSWETTVSMLRSLAGAVAARRRTAQGASA